MKTWLGRSETVNGITKEDVFITLNKKDSRNFKVILEYSGPIKAPIKKDQEIGIIKIKNKDEVIKNVKIYSSENVKKLNFIKSVFNSINYMIWGDA